MIIIDQGAETELLRLIRHEQASLVNYKLLYFNLGRLPQARDVLQHLTPLLLDEAQADHQLLFQCVDQDVFFLTPGVTLKNFKAITHKLAELVGEEHRASIHAQIFEIAISTGQVIELIQNKLQIITQQRAAEEDRRKQQAADKLTADLLGYPITPVQLEKIRRMRQERSKPQIMVVEDDLFLQRLIRNVLEPKGTLSIAENGWLALTQYLQHGPDILFLDINLPDVSGQQLLRKLIAVDPDLYIVMLTGNGDRQNVMQAMQHGARGFVVKPFTRDKLLHYVDQAVKGRKLVDA